MSGKPRPRPAPRPKPRPDVEPSTDEPRGGLGEITDHTK